MNISIIIPVYNVSQYIERCLLSVWEQSYNHLEIIIVDDASPDDSMDKIKNFLNQHPTSHKIKIITHPFNKILPQKVLFLNSNSIPAIVKGM